MYFDLFMGLPLYYQILLVYLVLINIGTFSMYGLDKAFAVSDSRRISEKTLLIAALCGGSLGALAAMKLFRHKTRKHSFLIWFVLVFLFQISIVLYVTQFLWTKTG
jgi:uncharacterized membrane protein YsdA (DUF1294 family)